MPRKNQLNVWLPNNHRSPDLWRKYYSREPEFMAEVSDDTYITAADKIVRGFSAYAGNGDIAGNGGEDFCAFGRFDKLEQAQKFCDRVVKKMVKRYISHAKKQLKQLEKVSK